MSLIGGLVGAAVASGIGLLFFGWGYLSAAPEPRSTCDRTDGPNRVVTNLRFRRAGARFVGEGVGMYHRISGVLIVAGSAGFGLLLILGIAGAEIGTADNLLTGLILLASAASAGVGTGLLAIDGSARSEGGASRFGLGLVAASLVGLIAAELWVNVFPIQGDPLSSPLILVFAGGYLGLLVGQVVVGLALVRRGGLRRIAGGVVLVGFVLVVVGAADLVVGGLDFALAVRFAGLVSLLLGWAGYGFIAARDASS